MLARELVYAIDRAPTQPVADGHGPGPVTQRSVARGNAQSVGMDGSVGVAADVRTELMYTSWER